jgi:hypothetical protein
MYFLSLFCHNFYNSFFGHFLCSQCCYHVPLSLFILKRDTLILTDYFIILLLLYCIQIVLISNVSLAIPLDIDYGNACCSVPT